jgi:glycosyltransferase involved in cell wall biosynthesis
MLESLGGSPTTDGILAEMAHGSEETNNIDLSLVIPVYKNAASLRELHGRLRTVLEATHLSYEIVFVNDACPEGSHLVLHDLAEEDPGVVVVELRKNIGQQRAILEGLRAATGAMTVLMDADLQDKPEDIPKLIRLLAGETSVVFAIRYGSYDSLLRSVASRSFKWLLHVLSGVPSRAGIFSVMDTRMKKALISASTSRVSVVASMGLAGLPFSSVPVMRSRRMTGISAYTILDRLRMGGVIIFSVLMHRLGQAAQRMGSGRRDRRVRAEP